MENFLKKNFLSLNIILVSSLSLLLIGCSKEKSEEKSVAVQDLNPIKESDNNQVESDKVKENIYPNRSKFKQATEDNLQAYRVRMAANELLDEPNIDGSQNYTYETLATIYSGSDGFYGGLDRQNPSKYLVIQSEQNPIAKQKKAEELGLIERAKKDASTVNDIEYFKLPIIYDPTQNPQDIVNKLGFYQTVTGISNYNKQIGGVEISTAFEAKDPLNNSPIRGLFSFVLKLNQDEAVKFVSSGTNLKFSGNIYYVLSARPTKERFGYDQKVVYIDIEVRDATSNEVITKQQIDLPTK